MSLRDLVLIRPDAIAPAELRWLIDYVRAADKTDSLVSSFNDDDADAEVEWSVNKEIRDTQEVALTEEAVLRMNTFIDRGVREWVNPFFDIEVRDWESPHILHYGVGGHYIPHVDAETLLKDDSDREFWEKTLDRDLSLVLFLNDDFTGGELRFPQLDLTLAPRAGTLICFPADHHFIHGVQPVTAGHRYTLVSWLRVVGVPTPAEVNEQAFAAFQQCWPEPFAQPSRFANRSSSKMR